MEQVYKDNIPEKQWPYTLQLMSVSIYFLILSIYLIAVTNKTHLYEDTH